MKHYTLILSFLLIFCACNSNSSNTDNGKEDKQNNKTSTIIKKGFQLNDLLQFNSEAALKAKYGNKVKRTLGYLPEGMGEYPNTTLFPDTPNAVQFEWKDDKKMEGLKKINVFGNKTDWKTKEGITLGTDMKTLEKINQKPFKFYGFAWDFSGHIASWEGGLLDKKTIGLILNSDDKNLHKLSDLMGDVEVNSAQANAQKLNPVVIGISLSK